MMWRIELTRAIFLIIYLYLIKCFLRVTVSLLCRLQAVSKMHVPIYPYLISKGIPNSSTWPAQQLSRDTLETCYQNIKTWANGWSNFSENLRIVALKLHELTRFASPNQSISFNFVWCVSLHTMVCFHCNA